MSTTDSLWVRRTPLERTLVGTWHWDFSTRLFDLDPHWRRSLGLISGDGPATLEQWLEYVHPDDVARLSDRMTDLRTGRAERIEVDYRVRATGNRWVWLLHRGAVLERSPDGRAAGATGICIEFDDRKRAESALQDSESRLATALWGARAALWQWRVGTGAFSMSPMWFALTGYSRDEWEGSPDPLFSRLHPEDRDHTFARFEEHAAGRSPSIEAEFRIRTATGEWKWILMRGCLVDWAADGTPKLAVGVSLDIDAQKRAELALHTAETRLETAVWGAQIGLWELDFRAGTIRWFGDWCDRLELDPCEGPHHLMRRDSPVHPEDVAEAERRFREHVAGEQQFYDAEYRIRDRNGRWRWLFERGRVVERAPDGRALRMVGVCVDIDARKESELEARRNQHRLEVALEIARGGMWDWDLRTDRISLTEYHRRMLGLSPDADASTRTFWVSRIHPEDEPRVTALMNRLVEGEVQVGEAEYRLRHEDGGWRWVLDRARASERDTSGKALRIVGFTVDVTDRVRTQEALRRSEFLYRTVASITPGYVFESQLMPDGRFVPVWISDGLKDVFGCTYAELQKLGGFLAFTDPESRAGIRERTAGIRAGRPQSGEIVVYTVTGERKWLHVNTMPVRDPQTGTVTGMIGSAYDITTRKLAEQALRESEAVLRAVTENTPDWLFLVDEQLRVRFVNRAFGGRGAEDLVGRTLSQILPAEHRANLEEQCRRVLAHGKPAHLDVEHAVDSGGTRQLELRIVPVVNAGAVRSLTVALTDVTERKRLERALIEIANREQQRIGSDLHDGLGQELTGIALLLRGIVAELHKIGSPLQRDVENVIGLVNSAIESTRALARGLSPVSAEQGGLVAALQSLANRAGERYGVNVGFRSKLRRPLRLDESAATHLYRIAQESLTNVIRHSHATAVTIRLETRADDLLLTIEDNGRGFTGSSNGSGGLGLKIMRYRAQMLGGDIVLETSASGGAVVRCVCPLGAATEEERETRARRAL